MNQTIVGSIAEFCKLLRQIPAGRLFRHNDAGDLPAKGRQHNFALTNAPQHKTGRAWRSRTSRSSCPATCELRESCYAHGGHVGVHWRKLGHYDAPGADVMDWQAVRQIAMSCSHLISWTYTHWDWRRYKKTFYNAIAAGFCINISTSNPAEALAIKAAGLPAALAAHPDARRPIVFNNTRAICCPATISKGFTCDCCGGSRKPLCARSDRSDIIMFPVHGVRSRAAWERIHSMWKEYL